MTYIELKPELDACVETQAKRRYNQIASQLLSREVEEKELSGQLETLRLFLETANFNQLRRESEKYLLKGKKVKFILHLEKGKPEYEMKVVQE